MMFDLQKANMWKRISAFLFDIIMIATLATGFGALISLITNNDSHYKAWNEGYEKYQEKYDVEFNLSEDDYLGLSDEEQAIWQQAYDELLNDSAVMREYNLFISFSMIIISLGVFFAVLVWEFIIPLFLGNGMSLGRKIFGLGVMRVDHVKITNIQLFIRAILGKYTIEIMVPVLIIMMISFNQIGLIGTLIIIGITTLQLVCMITTKTNSPIHDLLAGTVVIDFPSQKIFDTVEEMNAARKEQQGTV